MKTMRSSVLCLFVFLLAAPLLPAQGLAKYRDFTFGMSVAGVLKHTDQKLADVKAVHLKPALIQELTWWPPNLPGASFQADSVQQIRFSFCDGELYKISVNYDRNAIEGLSAEDMVKSISAKYGTPAKVLTNINFPTDDPLAVRQETVASWEDAQYSVNLVRGPYSEGFGLVMFSRQLNVQAEEALAKATKIEEQERPQKEVEHQQKEDASLEVARQKNKKIFHP